MEAKQLDTSTIALTDFIVRNLKDVELANAKPELSTQFIYLKAHAVTMTTITIENIEVTSGFAVDSKETTVSGLKWSGDNKLRKNIISMLGDTILMQESSFDNLNVEPLG